MYGRTIVVLCLVAALLYGNVDAQEDRKIGNSRIVNGQVINIGQAPYIVQLRLPGYQPFCGGTLVHKQYVISAAHCFDKFAAKDMIIAGGANTRNDRGIERRIAAVTLPEGYTSNTMNNDVAVIKLESPMIGENIQAVPLCSRPLVPGEGIQVSGWGKTVSGGATSEQLRTIRIPVISNAMCQAYHRYSPTPLTNRMVCAHNELMQDSCQGDSGGPAIRGGELCGIVSWGIGCASGLPGIYTNVYNLRNFIIDSINDM